MAFTGAVLLSALDGPDVLYFALGLLCTAGILRQAMPALMPRNPRARRLSVVTPAPRSRERPGFRARGRIRRRVRFLRRARDLAYRDLGGLVFTLHRFGQRSDALVLAKLAILARLHAELCALEAALREQRHVTDLRESGILACARCAAVHGSEDRFCPGCGLPADHDAYTPVSHAADVASSTAPTAAVGPAAEPAAGQQAPLATAGVTRSSSGASEAETSG